MCTLTKTCRKIYNRHKRTSAYFRLGSWPGDGWEPTVTPAWVQRTFPGTATHKIPLTRHAVFQKNVPTWRRNEATAATAARRRRLSCACPGRPTWSCPATQPVDNSRSSSPTHAIDGRMSSAGNYTKVRGRGQTTILHQQPRSVFINQNMGGGDASKVYLTNTH